MARETPPYMTTAKRTSRSTPRSFGSVLGFVVVGGGVLTNGSCFRTGFSIQPRSALYVKQNAAAAFSSCGSLGPRTLYDADALEASCSLMLISDVSVR